MCNFVLRIAQTSTLYHAEYVLGLEIDFLVFRVSVSFGTLSIFSAVTRFFGASESRTRYELGRGGGRFHEPSAGGSGGVPV